MPPFIDKEEANQQNDHGNYAANKTDNECRRNHHLGASALATMMPSFGAALARRAVAARSNALACSAKVRATIAG
jgi:hypothetical protein